MKRRNHLLWIILILILLAGLGWWLLMPDGSSDAPAAKPAVAVTPPAVETPKAVEPTPTPTPSPEPASAVAAAPQLEPVPKQNAEAAPQKSVTTEKKPSSSATTTKVSSAKAEKPAKSPEASESKAMPVAKQEAMPTDEPVPASEPAATAAAQPADQPTAANAENVEPAKEDKPEEGNVDKATPVAEGAAKSVFRNNVGSWYRLNKVTCFIDGVATFEKAGSFSEAELFSNRLPVGEHVLTVVAEYKGEGGAFFSYLDGYGFNVKAGKRFTVAADRDAKIQVTAYERGGATTKFEDRLALAIDTQ